MAVRSPVSIIFDTDGNHAVVVDNRLLTSATVSGVVQVADNGGSLTVDGPLTDAELRASAVPVSVASLPLPAGAATEATLSSFRTDFNNEDFATEATLSGLNNKDFATETTLNALLTAFNAEDFATQTTLAALLAAFNAEDFAQEATQADVLNRLEVEDFAQEATVSGLRGDFQAEDFAQDATLQSLQADFQSEDFAQELTQSGIKTELESFHTSFQNEDFASETTLSVIATDAAKETTQQAVLAELDNIQVSGAQLRAADGRVADLTTVSGVDRLDTHTSITDPGGTIDVEVHEIDGVQHLAAGKKNIIDQNNSSTAQLPVSGVFAGPGTDVSQFSAVAVTIHSDQNSAYDGMRFEFSMDNTNWDDSYKFNMHASESQTRRFQFPVCAQYFRVYYANGGVATTEFRCQTILQRQNILTSIHRVENVVRDDRSAQLTKGVIIAQREGALDNDFYPVKADIAGSLKVTTIGADIPSDPAQFVLEFLRNSGGSESMLVNGSVTPVPFFIGPTVTDETWSLKEVLITFTADDFNFDGVSFGPIAALTNGINFQVVKDGVTTNFFDIAQNEDFIRVPGRLPLVNNTGPKDVLGAVVVFDGLVLNQGTNDYVQMVVNDNLTSTKLKYLTATAFAIRVT